jgi:hypothetical protein
MAMLELYLAQSASIGSMHSLQSTSLGCLQPIRFAAILSQFDQRWTCTKATKSKAYPQTQS